MSDESDHEAARIASLGVRERVYRVELLHGICELAEVDALAEQPRYETGVLPLVYEW